MANIRVNEKDGRGEAGKTPLKFSKKRKYQKRWTRKKTILVVLLIFLSGLGYFGFKFYGVLSKIFSESGINLPGLLGDVAQLKGEKEGRVNVLLLGIGDEGHAGQNLSDTIMVVSIDTKNKKVAMVSIPRDMYVNIPGYGYSKINEAHAQGEMKKKGAGPEKAKETVAQVLDLPIHYYARVDFSGLSKIVDAVGGVDINVEKDIYDPYYPDGGTYSISKGKHHMNGKEALKYTRSRYTTSDFDRAKRQQQVILAVKTKALSTNTVFNPKKVLDIMTVLGNHVKTDFQLAEIKRAYELTNTIPEEQFIRKVIDNDKTGLLASGNAGGASILQPASGSWKEIRAFVRDIFSEGGNKDTSASILIVNNTGTQGVATKLAETLKSEGFTNVTTEMGEGVKTKSTIYDYTNEAKKETLQYLTKKVGGETIKLSSGKNSDFKIVLGSDYSAE